MHLRQPRYSKEEYARRGNEFYERLRPQVETGSKGKIVAIDIETGAFEVAEDTLAASNRLLARYPDAEIWFVRVGHRAVHRFGHYVGAMPARRLGEERTPTLFGRGLTLGFLRHPNLRD